MELLWEEYDELVIRGGRVGAGWPNGDGVTEARRKKREEIVTLGVKIRINADY